MVRLPVLPSNDVRSSCVSPAKRTQLRRSPVGATLAAAPQRRRGCLARRCALAAVALITAACKSAQHFGPVFVELPRGAAQATNEFFKRPLRLAPELESALKPTRVPTDLKSQLTAVGEPGVPRPLWLVIAASVPTGLLWYGAGYKLLAEEELYAYEMSTSGKARGFGGPGTLGPFLLGLLFGPVAEALGIPGGAAWSFIGVAWIYFTQYLLYERVNELYEQRGLPPPLHVWWLVFPGFNLLVGLRQVHFLSQFWALERNEEPPGDPVADLFPFIGAERYTWREFLRRPSLWLSPLRDSPDIDLDFLKDGTAN